MHAAMVGHGQPLMVGGRHAVMLGEGQPLMRGSKCSETKTFYCFFITSTYILTVCICGLRFPVSITDIFEIQHQQCKIVILGQ